MLKQIVLGIVLLMGLQGGIAWADEALTEALCAAVRGGYKVTVEELISKGADVNAKDNIIGKTPLDFAAYWGRKEVAELLISKGAVINPKDVYYTPLHYAAKQGKKDVAELLLIKGANVNSASKYDGTPLHLAATENELAVVELLISKGADVNAKEYYGNTPLFSASSKEVAELLISKGADVNVKNNDGGTPLHRAAYSGTKEVAELLLSKGLDVNARDKYDNTPLHKAAEENKKAVAELLISKGASMSVKNNDGKTPLHSAAGLGQKEVAEFLIFKGADVNAKDRYGETPLHTAVNHGKKETVEFLISKGADLNVKDDKGRTLLQTTEDIRDLKERQEILALLQGQMAKQLNPRQLLTGLLEQFKGHSDNDELRKSIIQAALKLQPPPAIPEEAEDAAGRAAYIFNNAKPGDDILNSAKEYLKAVEAAPWVADYYYNLCTVLEKTPFAQQALHACKLYLEASPNATDAADLRQRIAGLKFAVAKANEQIGQRTAFAGGLEEMYRKGGISGKVAGKDMALKLFVDWQASPPKYQVFSACFEGDKAFGSSHDLVSTDTWVNICGTTSVHLVIKPEGAGFVELGGGGSLRITLDELFQLKQKVLQQSPLFYNNGYGTDKGTRFYVAYTQGGRDDQYAGHAMYEIDCNGNLLRQDPRALPDEFASTESNTFRNFQPLLDLNGKTWSGCNQRFSDKTGYDF